MVEQILRWYEKILGLTFASLRYFNVARATKRLGEVRRVTGVKIPAKIVDRCPGDPAILLAASDKIRRELPWKPNYRGLEEIIGSAWALHSAHPNGYTTFISNHKK